MLQYFLTFFLLFANISTGSINPVGNYQNNFGGNLSLNPDNSFNFSWRFDGTRSWTNGTWEMNKDTIRLMVVPIFDTLRFTDPKKNVQSDTLILSIDNKSELVSLNFTFDNQSPKPIPMTMISFGGGQNFYPPPQKLFYSDSRLIEIDSIGNLILEKQKGFWTDKTYDPWFIKTEIY